MVLDTIIKRKKVEVEQVKKLIPLQQMVSKIKQGNFAFSRALESSWNLIAECKLASPVKGSLCQTYSILDLAKIYTHNGAAALSVHTDRHFRGKLEDIEQVKQISHLPVLRKDFIIDEYQIYEARHAGADAILLIAAVLTPQMLKIYLDIAHDLGLDCLVEVHTSDELETVHKTNARLVGINNRDLKTFTTSIDNTIKLAGCFMDNKIYISESGIKDRADAVKLKATGVHGILVGEGLVTAADIPAKVRELALKNEDGGYKYA